jgi:hypothetical protein
MDVLGFTDFGGRSRSFICHEGGVQLQVSQEIRMGKLLSACSKCGTGVNVPFYLPLLRIGQSCQRQ